MTQLKPQTLKVIVEGALKEHGVLNQDQREYVLTCIATHAELIEVLEATLDDADPTGCEDCAVVSNTVLERGRAVLAKAKGGTS